MNTSLYDTRLAARCIGSDSSHFRALTEECTRMLFLSFSLVSASGLFSDGTKSCSVLSGLSSVAFECVHPTIAAFAAKRPNRGDPTSKLLCNTFAFRAMNVGTAADWTLVRANDVEHFHKRAKSEAVYRLERKRLALRIFKVKQSDLPMAVLADAGSSHITGLG
jgi:hypothetical protein